MRNFIALTFFIYSGFVFALGSPRPAPSDWEPLPRINNRPSMNHDQRMRRVFNDDTYGFGFGNYRKSAIRTGKNFRSGCGSVYVNCLDHTINIDGVISTIDCGKGGTTTTGSGRVGGRHKGPKVPDGLRMKTTGMYYTKVFHTWGGYRRDGRNYSYPPGTRPRGQDTSAGCVIVDDATYAKLKSSCVGKPLTIQGNDGRRLASSSRAHRSWKRQIRNSRN